MRKMKGQMMIEFMVVSVVLILFTVFLLSTNSVVYGGTVANAITAKEKVEVVDFAHLAEKCFSEDRITHPI